MNSNQIGDYFYQNTIGDNDGQDFVYNTITSHFYNNFITFETVISKTTLLDIGFIIT
jgi:hypothetical protein